MWAHLNLFFRYDVTTAPMAVKGLKKMKPTDRMQRDHATLYTDGEHVYTEKAHHVQGVFHRQAHTDMEKSKT